MKFKVAVFILVSVLMTGPIKAETNEKEENKMEAVKVVENYFNYLQKGDLEKLGGLFDENVVWHQPGRGQLSGTYRGKNELFALFGEFMERSGGTFKIDEVSSIMANGDLVVANLHFSATKSKESISMGGVDLMRVQNGKILEVHLFSSDQEAEDRFWSL